MAQIHKSGIRKSLAPRREPYWSRISRGQYIGFRKLLDGEGTWIARRRSDDGKQEYKSLGFDTDAFGIDQATAAAEHWFKLKDSDIKDDIVTVADACRRYVEERRTSKSESCAHDAHKRFERTVYGRRHPKTEEVVIDENALGKRELAKLRATHIKTWRDGLDIGSAASNRTLTALKAALYLAVSERNVIASQAQEWAEVTPLPTKRRQQVFLDLDQRRAFIEAASGAARNLIHAAIVTGARPGELVHALRSQWDGRTASMTFSGKTGTRTVPLSATAAALFDKLAKAKLPTAHLLPRDDGNPWPHSGWDEPVKEAAKKAGLPERVTLYSCRHSWITQAITDGMSILDVARLQGTSIQMIEATYGHLVASAARERLAKVTML